MAKRKRLSPASPEVFGTSGQSPQSNDTKSDWTSMQRTSAPIAEVSSDASLRAALHEVTDELTRARAEGRFVAQISLTSIDSAHLVRDRIAMDADELQSLIDSLRIRGQQTPIEVVDLGAGEYGLISGWRRLTALRLLAEETGEERFAKVQALVRRPDSAASAYLAMVEENEIRAGLSFYERARIAVQAVRQGVHRDAGRAVQALFAAARAPKRSKILSFVTLVEALDAHLQFPAAIPEKLGLALAIELRADPAFRRRLTEALRKATPATPEAERGVLERCLKPSVVSIVDTSRESAPSKTSNEGPSSIETKIASGVILTEGNQHLTLAGPGVTPGLVAELRVWLAQRSV